MGYSGVLDESNYPQRKESVYSEPYRIGYVPSGTSNPVYTPQAQVALQNIRPGSTLTGWDVAAAYRGLNGPVGSNPPRAMYNAATRPRSTGGGGGAPGGGGGGGAGGGGGGGGGGAAGITQAQMDYIAQLLGAGRPKQGQASQLNLPEYKGMAMRPFDPSQFDLLQKQFGEAVTSDRAAAAEAYGNLNNYLNSNYRNAFAGGGPTGAAPGMDQQAMARMLQSQGVNPANNAQLNNAQQGMAGANAAFGNLWGLLGATEDTAQRNRLLRAQQDQGTTNR